MKQTICDKCETVLTQQTAIYSVKIGSTASTLSDYDLCTVCAGSVRALIQNRDWRVAPPHRVLPYHQAGKNP